MITGDIFFVLSRLNDDEAAPRTERVERRGRRRQRQRLHRILLDHRDAADGPGGQ